MPGVWESPGLFLLVSSFVLFFSSFIVCWVFAVENEEAEVFLKSSFLLFSLSLLFSPLSFSAMKPKLDLRLQCVSGMPTTSFYLRTEGEFAILKIVHHNGVEFMPIHEGIIVPHDLTYLKEKAALLTPMGEQVEYKFPLKKCEIYGPGLISCSGGDRQTFNGVEIESLMFYTSKLHEETLGISIDSWKATVDLHAIDHGPVMEVSMNYTPEECQFNF